MNRKLGSCTTFSWRSLFFVNHSLLLFFARSRKKAKNSVVKYVDFSPMRGPPRGRIRFPQFERSLAGKTVRYLLDSARGAELVSVVEHAGLGSHARLSAPGYCVGSASRTNGSLSP